MKTNLPVQRLHLAVATILFALFACSHACSQTVPALVNYQGRLANPDGSPLPTADYTLTFNLFNAATNGTRVWGPQIFDGPPSQGHGARIPVVQGWFNVMLGPVDTNGAALSDAFNGTSRYVEVTVSNRSPIAPRQQILTTPFAFQAANSAKLAGYDWSALLGTNNPVAGTISTAKLADGAVTLTKLAQRSIGTNFAGPGGIAFSQSSGFQSMTIQELTETPVTNLSVTLVTTGRPVMVFLSSVEPSLPVADLQSGYSWVGVYHASPNANVFVNVYRTTGLSTNLISRSFLLMDTGSGAATTANVPPSFIQLIDSPPAGTNSYSITTSVNTFSQTVGFINVRLVAFEL